MDDATSTPRRPWAMKLLTRMSDHSRHIHMGSLCHFCGIGGRIVATFPRRGYG
jgi:hypothetical protein